jgi:hypothetical protein
MSATDVSIIRAQSPSPFVRQSTFASAAIDIYKTCNIKKDIVKCAVAQLQNKSYVLLCYCAYLRKMVALIIA